MVIVLTAVGLPASDVTLIVAVDWLMCVSGLLIIFLKNSERVVKNTFGNNVLCVFRVVMYSKNKIDCV